MRNPWKEMPLTEYELHMSSDTVKQLQAINAIMKAQLSSYPLSSIMILGIAGGNGLEHIEINKFRKVYGVDNLETGLMTII